MLLQFNNKPTNKPIKMDKKFSVAYGTLGHFKEAGVSLEKHFSLYSWIFSVILYIQPMSCGI